MYNGLTDVDYQGNIVPSIAESWEPNKELTAWVFRLRKGVLFHNGREVDAEAVKLNLLRMKDPAIGHDYLRGAIETIESVDVLDKYTVRINASVPDVSIPSSVMRYPTILQAPDNFDKASEHPIGTGPFKFVSWTRFNETRLVRFENYWETDAEGNNLPYLDEIIGKPKREDSVRLTALRTGQVQLIDAMAYADVERFQKTSARNTTSGSLHSAASLWPSTGARGPFRTSSCAPPRRTPSIARRSTIGVLRPGRHARPALPTWQPGTWRAAAWSMTLTRPSPCSSRHAPWVPRSRSF